MPVNIFGNVDECDIKLNIVKNKKASHQNSATPNSIFRCVTAPVHNKLYLQYRKILTLSVTATYGKGKYFSRKVFTNSHKQYNKTRAIAMSCYMIQMLIAINIIILTAETFLRIEGKPSKLLQSFKILKNERKYSKKAQYSWPFFGSTKVFR